MCLVQILSVNGITPPGSAGPTQLRVAGRLSQCPSGQVVVRSSITGQSPPTSPTYGVFGDGFIIVLPITAPNVACDDAANPITVVAECYQRAACNDTYNGPLKCCEVVVNSFTALVPPGSLTPTHIRVSGTAHGCASAPFIQNDPVVVRVTFGSGASVQSGLLPVEALTGAFSTQLAIPATTSVQCDDHITADAWCSSHVNCAAQSLRGPLDCPQCARAVVTIVSTGPCVGTPPMQAVTLGATINISKGTRRHFRWRYGDGTLSPVFEIDNTAGLATTPHTVPPYPPPVSPNPAVSGTHDYAPGSYTAALIVTNAQGVALECDEFPITVVATCSQCPSVTVTASSPGACVNGKRKVTLQTLVGALPATTVFQWQFGDGQQGLAQGATMPGAWPASANPSVNEHDYAPGVYTATLLNVLSPACPPVTLTITIDPCPAVCCPQVALDPPMVAGCAPGSAMATFVAHVNWMAGCTAVAPASFQWTLNGPGGKKYQRSTSLPNADTTTGWTDPGGNPAMVQFAAGGNYSISVTAIIPGVALPCNPTDTTAFTVQACCPQLIGPLNASPKPGDPCTWLFSAQVSNPNNAPNTFAWAFQDGTTATTTQPQVEHTYAAGSITTGNATLTLKAPGCPDQTLTAVVTHMCTPCPAGQSRDANGNCVKDPPPACPPGQHRDASGNCVPDRITTTSCDVLLWISLIFILLSGLGAVGGCVLGMWYPFVAAIIGYIALALLAIGLVLFFIWWLVCRQQTACSVILAAITFVRVLIAVFFVIGVILGLIALGGWNPQWLFCLAVSWIQSGIWGLILSVLYGVAVEMGCLVENPSGGSSSSSNPLTSSGVGPAPSQGRFSEVGGSAFSAEASEVAVSSRPVARGEPAHILRAPWLVPNRIIGLGDIVKGATSALGIQPCIPCHERAARLNQWVGLVGGGVTSTDGNADRNSSVGS